MDELDKGLSSPATGAAPEPSLARFSAQIRQRDLVMPALEQLMLDLGLGESDARQGSK
jgi:hypothetical protein